jgi:hypothetical protein
MPKPFKEWTVLPHGKLMKLEDDLLSVVGKLEMPLGDYPRRMTVVRLQDGRLVIYSAIALDEPEMEALEEYGTPAFLIVPGDIHRLDARIWKDRYPGLMVIAPAGARERVEQVVPVDATEVDFGDPRVRFVAVPGTEGHEAALLIERPSGATLVVNDLIWNLDHRRGLGGWGDASRRLHRRRAPHSAAGRSEADQGQAGAARAARGLVPRRPARSHHRLARRHRDATAARGARADRGVAGVVTG